MRCKVMQDDATQENITSESLTPKQTRALEALLTEPTVRDAAKRVRLNEATLWRWLKRSAFQEAYRQTRRRMLEHSIARLQGASGEAVEALRQIATDTSQPAGARVSAAKAILDISVRGVQLIDMADLEATERFALGGTAFSLWGNPMDAT
jgi:hypothetical protein